MNRRLIPRALALAAPLCSLASPALALAESAPVAAAGPATPDDLTIDASTRSQVIDTLIERLNETYVFPDLAKSVEKTLRQKEKKRAYAGITSGPLFATALTADIREITHDKHIRVRFSLEPLPAGVSAATPTLEEREAYRREAAALNYGFRKLERLEGNIGYLALDQFIDPAIGGETAHHAMQLLADTDALIIDLRQNGGGDPAMVALLCSYLFDGAPVHLTDLYTRKDNVTQQYWTHPYVPGRRMPHQAVYVLTSAYSFSAAEELAYDLQTQKRATIVGETTAGGANPGAVFPLGDHFGIFIPDGRAINPISGTNWEGTGVAPDVQVPADLALHTARVLALERLIAAGGEDRPLRALQAALSEAKLELEQARAALPPEAPPALSGKTTFRLDGFADARRVRLLGRSQGQPEAGWSFGRGADGWVCRVDLPPGKFVYQIQIDGQRWLDLHNPRIEATGRQFSSVLEVE